MTTAGISPSNPVYDGYFADPFVWRVGETYYAVGTGEAEATGLPHEEIFPLLRSEDFITWKFIGHAIQKADHALGNCFWAPAVAYADGKYWLYYSAGYGDKAHRLRVAISEQPQGSYSDLGITLLSGEACPFAIDPHPFLDQDGSWYMFYAGDFLDVDGATRAGTALSVTRMRTMSCLENGGQTVLRARQDWQRFQENRLMYERVWDWHTLEGPCVLKHRGRYYCFYSGGRWENDSYGVDYGVAQSVTGPYSDDGSETGPRVLRTEPGKVIGPGHNTIVIGPDEITYYIVYHAWDPEMTARRMFIDRLCWTAEGPRCVGPTIRMR